MAFDSGPALPHCRQAPGAASNDSSSTGVAVPLFPAPPLSPTFVLPPARPPSSGSKARTKPTPPRLRLPSLEEAGPTGGIRDGGGQGAGASGAAAGEGSALERPALFVQPASPALSLQSPATFESNGHEREASTTAPAAPRSPSFALSSSPVSTSPPPLSPLSTSSPLPLPLVPPASPGGGLAARRAAKLGKKRLALVVPTSNHIAVNNSALLSPTSPSHLVHPTRSLSLNANDPTSSSTDSASLLEAAETRSLPPSPISLVSFIGTEGSEAPDRTIGRLMLKQQADEMREQMRGGRGMKRRTSIPRLALKPTSLAVGSSTRSNDEGGSTSSSSSFSTATTGRASSAVEFLRREGSTGSDEAATEDVEEFPYAFGPREILPGIYLGSEQNAKDPRVLSEWKIGFVLNVAKEVDCPWVDERVDEQGSEEEGEETGCRENGQREQEKTVVATGDDTGRVEDAMPKSTPRPSTKHKHRRTKTQAAIDVRNPQSGTKQGDARPIRPLFIRPTASTPNLQSVFHSTSPPPVPPLPAVPSIPVQAFESSEKMLRSLSSSPPTSTTSVPRRSPARKRLGASTSRSSRSGADCAPSTCKSKGVVRFSENRRTGRPSLEYLWLKWGHDESDLVEAHKFQNAFDFLDEARARDERVLVHCQCGVSRSATVVIAYCMREAAKALEEGRDAKELTGCTGMHDTYSFVKEKSEWIGPNLGLVFQLVAYERTLRGDSGDLADEDEPAYPHYPPEPVEAPSSEASFASHPVDVGSTSKFQGPQTPVSLDGSMSTSQYSTPDLYHPLSPTFSSGTRNSSVNSTPLSGEHPAGSSRFPTPDVVDHSRDLVPSTGLEGIERSRRRHSSIETLKGEPQVFVLPPPPLAPVTGREEVVSPTAASYPSPALSPLELPKRGLKSPRRPPPLSINGHLANTFVPTSTIASATLAGSSTPVPTPPATSPARPNPAASLPSLTTTGLPPSLGLPRNASDLASPGSALTLSSDSSNGTQPLSSSSSHAPGGGSVSGTATPTGHPTTTKKFGAQTKSERRASHRRVFSETIKPNRSVISAPAAPLKAVFSDEAKVEILVDNQAVEMYKLFLRRERWKAQAVNERSKKANLSHQVAYGETKQVRPSNTVSVDYVDSTKSPYVEFEIKYLSRNLLELQDIVKPAVRPPPCPDATSASPVASTSAPVASTSASTSAPSVKAEPGSRPKKRKPHKDLKVDKSGAIVLSDSDDDGPGGSGALRDKIRRLEAENERLRGSGAKAEPGSSSVKKEKVTIELG
ncbi:hypothetical protein JCM10212_006183 [Sporobolomyces blumeae]